MPAADDLLGRLPESLRLGRMLAEDTECAVVVSGEPGIGTSALIDQMCARAAGGGWHVVRILHSTGGMPLTQRLVAVFGERLGQLSPGGGRVVAGSAGRHRRQRPVADPGAICHAERPACDAGRSYSRESVGGDRLSPSPGSRGGHPSG